MYKAAEDVLRQSIKFADGPQLRMMLGDAMLEQNDMEEAAINYAHVVTVNYCPVSQSGLVPSPGWSRSWSPQDSLVSRITSRVGLHP